MAECLRKKITTSFEPGLRSGPFSNFFRTTVMRNINFTSMNIRIIEKIRDLNPKKAQVNKTGFFRYPTWMYYILDKIK